MTHLTLHHPGARTTARSRPHGPLPVPQRSGSWATLTAIGLVGGVLSGLFAIGGGILMVPLLTSWARMDQRRAAAMSLVAIVPTALISSLVYLAHGQIDLAASLFVALGAVVGAVVGSKLLRLIPVARLQWMFVGFLVLIAARMLLVAPERGDQVQLSVLVAVGYVVLGLVMGISSGLFGIGGGIIAVPLMISVFAVSDLVAKGTSLLVSVPTSAIGSIANRRAGLVDVRAGLIVGVAAAAASIPSASLALILPARLSGLLFAALLIAVATHLGIKTHRAQVSR